MNDRPPPPDDPAILRRLAERVVTEAAEHLRGLPRPWDEPADPAAPLPGVATKSTRTDVVTASDTALEALVRERLGQLRPGEPVVGEEQGGAPADGVVTWVVDPIDGTVNFLYGLPWYAVSLAATRDGVTLAGAIAEPASGRLWSAARGGGATCDGRPLRCGVETDLGLALVGTGFGYTPQRRAAQAAFLGAVLPRIRDLRRSGSSALDVCAVAAGWLDAYLEHGPHWWDWAAAALIAAEAGAHVRPPATGDGAGLMVAAVPGISAALDAALIRCGAVRG